MKTLKQLPNLDQHIIRFCGEELEFSLEVKNKSKGKAFLRTNLNRGNIRLEEIIKHTELELPPLNKDWYDIPMNQETDEIFRVKIALHDVGRFEAKTYWQDIDQVMYWPEGSNTIIKVEPAHTCTYNTMYTAFVRLFGSAKSNDSIKPSHQNSIETLDAANYTVIPQSGTFRDLINQLDFIIGELRCRIIQLLPIHPTPTTYARMGRFGSPFAALDLLDIDPALTNFDKKTTPLDQFQELVDAIHYRDGLMFMDMPINHTGWASHLQNHHPDWFDRSEKNNTFKSPGAWGVLWEDLSKLDYSNTQLWIYMANVFLFWCKRGVDGFRCDAGYKIPFKAWNYITAKVRLEYPNTVFMLEGLGGDPVVTEDLLANGGMNWAYSEIFQNYDRKSIESYLPNSLKISTTKGNLIHFSETHDNERLANISHEFARLRTAFCALSSINGTVGFANGVEWFASKQIKVHSAYSLNWGSKENQVEWLKRIHVIMEIHPSFHMGSTVKLITKGLGNYLFILRESNNKKHKLLILINFDLENDYSVSHEYESFTTNLLGERNYNGSLKSAEIQCLSDDATWKKKIDKKLGQKFTESEIIKTQCLKAKILQILNHFEIKKKYNYNDFFKNPYFFLDQLIGNHFITFWNNNNDYNRTVMIPNNNILVVTSDNKFIAEIKNQSRTIAREKSIKIGEDKFAAIFIPLPSSNIHVAYELFFTLLGKDKTKQTKSNLLSLTDSDNIYINNLFRIGSYSPHERLSICTNNIGSFSQTRDQWSSLLSKYDGLLQGNLHPEVPTDRHIMLTRCRGWILFNGFSTELNIKCQTHFGSLMTGETLWYFNVPVGQGFVIRLIISLRLHKNKNAIQLKFERCASSSNKKELPNNKPVTLILRPDIEDRISHQVTKINNNHDYLNGSVISNDNGFTFSPSNNRSLNVFLDHGSFHTEPEWYYQIIHPIDKERYTDGISDLFSPGYFKKTLIGNQACNLFAGINCEFKFEETPALCTKPTTLKDRLLTSMQSFIVKRNQSKTIIAGYPWFLDWGRDTLICLRGIIAAGMTREAKQIIIKYASFEKQGTLPNMIHGEDKHNRDTSDAPLWLFVACSDYIKKTSEHEFLREDCGNRSLQDVLLSIINGYMQGTENGIYMDEESSLIFSPSHFTWMDTNHPAGTPREGYPIEIQALWYFSLNFAYTITKNEKWVKLANNVKGSILKYYILTKGNINYLADNLSIEARKPVCLAIPDDALRCNQILTITLGCIKNEEIGKDILNQCDQLLVPGAIRSLADKKVDFSAPIYFNGKLLNNPNLPYQGHYTGDENTNRKPAYHNGTAWTWIFPSYIEALILYYGPTVKSKSMSFLNSSSLLVESGCIGQIPEILDGDTPHKQRGCCAQAWGITELYRVYNYISEI